ncbi:MAG: class I SAM-dependent rRNA methyltransferase [Deltaproteobacteria bacterium]|nr:class I SAM-dependent rRNA methyltransferase [Deltaproteobacteria bacterium]
MTPLVRPWARPHRVTLARDLRRAVKRGHPWVFSDALRGLPPDAEPGDPAVLLDSGKRVVAHGYVDPGSPLAFRVGDADGRAPLDDAWAMAGLERALALRAPLFDDRVTTGFRAVHGEGDGLPGLVVDVYADVGVVRCDGPAAEGFWNTQGVGAWLAGRLGLRSVVERYRARGEASGRQLVGEPPTAPVPFLENGMRFTADVVNGQKTGFYLDQRDNRARVRRLAAGRRALNVFGYTGGFSIAAGLGGATHVTTVDRAEPAVAESVRHWALNELAPDAHEGVVGDAFEVLEAARSGPGWDLVVLDPPAFATSKKTLDNALGAYTAVITAGLRVARPGAIVVVASCSAHLGLTELEGCAAAGLTNTRRRADLLDIAGQPPDHPAPLACPELRYLKALFLRVE